MSFSRPLAAQGWGKGGEGYPTPAGKGSGKGNGKGNKNKVWVKTASPAGAKAAEVGSWGYPKDQGGEEDEYPTDVASARKVLKKLNFKRDNLIRFIGRCEVWGVPPAVMFPLATLLTILVLCVLEGHDFTHGYWKCVLGWLCAGWLHHLGVTPGRGSPLGPEKAEAQAGISPHLASNGKKKYPWRGKNPFWRSKMQNVRSYAPEAWKKRLVGT